MGENITEDNLRQLRDEVDRLFAEAQAKLRQGQAANSDYRAALLVTYPVMNEEREENDTDYDIEQI